MKKFLLMTALAACSTLWTGCTLTQEPKGQGVDPTQVNVEVAVDLNLELPDNEGAYADLVPEVTDEFTRRFVVEAVLTDGTVAERQVSYEKIVPGKTEYALHTKFRLNARQYKLLVWSDYVKTEDTETNLYYDPSSLTPVLPWGNYVGNNERKDCFRGLADLDLRKYRDEWAASVSLDVELARPVGRYEIITTDLGAFRQRLADGLISGSEFSVRVRYADYRATGYNVLQNVPKNFLSYLFYKTTLNTENWNADQASMRLGFDYCFVDAGEAGSKIPVEIEILNENNQQVSRTVLSIPVVQGYNTVVSGRFMTGTDDGSVSVDTAYDGVVDIDLGKL